MRIGSSLDINLSLLEHNFSLIKKESNNIIPMVKANAYGHGILEISSFLLRELKVKSLGVATLGEALYLRQNLPSDEFQILVFSDFNLRDKDSKEIISHFDIDIVLSSIQSLKIFLDEREFSKKKLILKFDTGMHRLGIEPHEIREVISLIQKSGRKEISHLMSHFSSSYLEAKKIDYTKLQVEEFLKIKNELQSYFAIDETSISNSGGIEQNLGALCSSVRPGLMLYGPESYPKPNLTGETKLISSLRTYLLKKRTFKKGEPIGYGRSIIPYDGVVLYLPLGYGDGLLTHMSGLDMNINGAKAKVVGRINMDLSCYIISEKDSGLFSEGDEIFLWKNDNQTLKQIYEHCNTSPYHILTSISQRIPRYYL